MQTPRSVFTRSLWQQHRLDSSLLIRQEWPFFFSSSSFFSVEGFSPPSPLKAPAASGCGVLVYSHFGISPDTIPSPGSGPDTGWERPTFSHRFAEVLPVCFRGSCIVSLKCKTFVSEIEHSRGSFRSNLTYFRTNLLFFVVVFASVSWETLVQKSFPAG